MIFKRYFPQFPLQIRWQLIPGALAASRIEVFWTTVKPRTWSRASGMGSFHGSSGYITYIINKWGIELTGWWFQTFFHSVGNGITSQLTFTP